MTPCNVQLFGYGQEASSLRLKINEILQREGNAHGSITTIIESSVKCAEHPDKDEPYLRVYSDDLEGGKQVALTLFEELDQAVELVVLAAVYVPGE